MTEPQPLPTSYYLQLSDAIGNYLSAREQLDQSLTSYGPDSVGYAQDRISSNQAHRQLMSAVTDFLERTTDSKVFTGIPTSPTSVQVPPQELATTQWVREYVHKQPAPWSTTNLVITLLSGILGGLIVTLLGAVLLLLLP